MKNWSYKFIILIATFVIVVASVLIWLFVPSKKDTATQIISETLLENNSLQKDEINKEQYDVYSALIKDLYIDGRSKLLVFEEETTGCLPKIDDGKMIELKQQMEDSAINELSALLPQTISDFQNKSKKCQLLTSQFSTSIKFTIASQNVVSNIFRENDIIDGWSRFYDKYPNSSGLINFSNIGFNSEMTQAFVYTGRTCGGKCGAGYYFVLEKKNSRWVVVDKVNNWVS